MDIARLSILLLALVTTAVLVIYNDADVVSTSTNTIGRLLRLGTGKITYNDQDKDKQKQFHRQLSVRYVFDPKTVEIKAPSLRAKKGKTMNRNTAADDWIQTSKAAQLLREELSKSLSPEEYKEWFVTPNFHPFPDQEKWFYHLPGKNNADDSLRYECPPPRKTEFNFKSIAELEFTKVQKDKLRAELNQGSIAIKNTFEPWIDKGGFHPDLILHRATNLMIGIIDGVLHLSYRGAFQGKYWDVAKHLESVVEVRRRRF